MATRPTMDRQVKGKTERNAGITAAYWTKLGLLTALVSVVAVLLVQNLALLVWPETALFQPLDSYPRTVIFTVVPVIGATALLAWLVAQRPQPLRPFVTIALIFLIVSFVPDYLLPIPHRTLLASSVAAFLHVVAGIIITGMLVSGYQRRVSAQ